MNYSNKWSTDRLMEAIATKDSKQSKVLRFLCCLLFIFSLTYFGSQIGRAIYLHYQSPKTDYSQLVYNDPFRTTDLKPEQREILNYAVAQFYLKDELRKHPEWSGAQARKATHQIEKLFHVKHLRLNDLTDQQNKKLIEVYNIVSRQP